MVIIAQMGGCFNEGAAAHLRRKKISVSLFPQRPLTLLFYMVSIPLPAVVTFVAPDDAGDLDDFEHKWTDPLEVSLCNLVFEHDILFGHVVDHKRARYEGAVAGGAVNQYVTTICVEYCGMGWADVFAGEAFKRMFMGCAHGLSLLDRI